MTDFDFLNTIKDALELERDIQLEDEFRHYEEWDSMTFLSLLTLMRDQYGINLDIDTFNNITTWSDLFNLIEE